MEKEAIKGSKTQDLAKLFELVDYNWRHGLALARAGKDADVDLIASRAEMQEFSAKFGFDIKPKDMGRDGEVTVVSGRVVEVHDVDKFVSFVTELAQEDPSSNELGMLLKQLVYSFLIQGDCLYRTDEQLNYKPVQPKIRFEDKEAFFAIEDIAMQTEVADIAKVIVGMLRELSDEEAAEALVYVGYEEHMGNKMGHIEHSPLVKEVFLNGEEEIVEKDSVSTINDSVLRWFNDFKRFLKSPTACDFYANTQEKYRRSLVNIKERLLEMDSAEDISKIQNFVERELVRITETAN